MRANGWGRIAAALPTSGQKYGWLDVDGFTEQEGRRDQYHPLLVQTAMLDMPPYEGSPISYLLAPAGAIRSRRSR